MQLAFVSFFLAAPLASTGEAAPAPAPMVEGRDATVPFRLEKHGNIYRPMVVASFNSHPIQMIVHSNASFYSQLLHRDAVPFGVVLSGSHSGYGIDRPGHRSALGRDRGTIASLSVGRSSVRNAPVSVFELPIGANEHLGMLGLGWIRQNRIVLDFATRTVTVAPSDERANANRERLLASGYVALPMTYDTSQERYTVMATINGVTRVMAVTTASPFEVDTAFASSAKVRFGKQDGRGFGPSGTGVPLYRLGQPVRLTIGGWTSLPIRSGVMMDDYGYNGVKRPSDPQTALGGTLGTAFLKESRAIIDFGEATLFVHR